MVEDEPEEDWELRTVCVFCEKPDVETVEVKWGERTFQVPLHIECLAERAQQPW